MTEQWLRDWHIDLSPKWQLGADDLQWILYRRRERLTDATRRPWEPVRFIASNKAVLMRDIDELGVDPTPEALRALGRLPATFSEFKTQKGGDGI